MAEIDAADWSLRPPPFTELRIVARPTQALPGMSLRPELESLSDWTSLCNAWLAMAPHPHILELIDDDPPTLRYAAIDWRAAPTPGEEFPVAIKLARVFEHIVDTVPRQLWVHFLRPKVMFDLRGEPRVWFLPVGPTSKGIAPEASKVWLTPTEKLLVFTLGRLLGEIGLESHPSGGRILRQCRAALPLRRTKRVQDALVALESMLPLSASSRDPSWELVETGIGWLALDRVTEAQVCFADAVALKPSRLAAEGLKRAIRPVQEQLASLGNARRLEAEGWWTDALDEYRRCRSSMPPVDYHLSIARCTLGMGNPMHALEIASRAVQAAPREAEPYELIVRAALEARRLPVATAACHDLADLSPEKALPLISQTLEASISCGRLVEARSCLTLLRSVAPSIDVTHRSGILARAARSVSSMGSEAVIGPLSAVPDAIAICLELHAVDPEGGIRALADLAHEISRHSIDHALAVCERLHELAPARAVEPSCGVVEAAYRRGELAAALSLCNTLVERFPASALVHYRRGRCLFGLGRLIEAREELEHAQSLDPKLIDAMLLRREVDRALGKVRDVVGSAFPQQQLAIPAHLSEVKAAMARGSVPDAVSWLESHEIGDGEARLLLGMLLVGQERYVDAVRAFDRVSGPHAQAARVGKAKALAASGRGEEALRILDRVVAEDPESTEAMVVRARVVALLRP